MAARNLFGINTTLASLSASDPTSRIIVLEGGRLDVTPEDLCAGSIDVLVDSQMTAIRTSCQMDATEGLSAMIECAPTVLCELTDEPLDSLRSDLPAQGWTDCRRGEIGMAVEICESDATGRSRAVKTPDMASGPLILPAGNDAWARAPWNGFRRKYRNRPLHGRGGLGKTGRPIGAPP